MSVFKSGWYLIYTRPRHEKKVFNQLKEKSVNCFLPTRKVLRAWHDRWKPIDEPLFPSYVFLYLNDLQGFYHGIDSEGALSYVRIGKDLARVSETVVNNIRLVVEGENEIEVSTAFFQPGQRLLIKQGALSGLSCEVVHFKGEEKILVRVQLLLRNLLITLPADHLMAAADSSYTWKSKLEVK